MTDVVRDAIRTIATGGTLTRDGAREVMGCVMRGDVEDVCFGALFVSLHARGETVDELAGFCQSMRDHVVAVTAPAAAIDTCGTGGDGADTFNVSTCAAFVVAGAGATVAKHGNRAVSSRCGSADVLEALGGTLETEPDQVQRSLARAGFAFLFAPSFHPAMRHAAAPRRALGVRTAFNFLGPITNPAGVTRQVVGVGEPAMAERIADVLRELGTERALVVHGNDGLDELTLAGSSVIYDVKPAGIRRMELSPEDVGLRSAPVSDLVGGDRERNARILREVLEGAVGAPRDVVVFNAAAGMVVAGIADDVREGVQCAQESIDSGAALDRLERWITGDDEEAAA